MSAVVVVKHEDGWGRPSATWVWWYCPGCERRHGVGVNTPNGWTYNDDSTRPTLSPSILVHSHKTLIDHDLEPPALIAPENITDTPTCHSFMRDGRIEFLSDCTHPLAGQTVDMAPRRCLGDW